MVQKCTKCKSFQYAFDIDKKQTYCKYCREPLVNLSMKIEDYSMLRNMSNDDYDFVYSMEELKEKDPIEFQTKLNQFKQQSQNKNIPTCPTCQSTNIRRITGGERVGSILTFGIFSRKINKSFKCKNCGYMW